MPKLHSTQTAIEQIAAPPKHENGATRQVIYFDTDLPRFGVRVTSGGAKTFVVQAWHAGRAPRVTMGFSAAHTQSISWRQYFRTR